MYRPPDNIPEAMQHYLRMWNELDSDAIHSHLDLAVSEDCLWVDPHNYHVGRDALLQNVQTFRANYPAAELAITSNVDSHNRRYRYDWRISVNGSTLMDGFDVATLNAAGLIERVDGLFGVLQRIK
jgi:hypothetical protein